MTSVTQKRLTAEQFALLPEPADGAKQELVNGEVVTMPPPRGLHGLVCSKVDRRVGAYVEDHRLGHVCANDTGFIIKRNPDTVRGPDIAFWSLDRLPEVPDAYIAVAPDLAIEVASSSKELSRLRAKLREYFKRQVRLVWVIDIAKRTLTVYRSLEDRQILSETDIVSGEDVLPGFTCLIRDFLP